MTYLNFLARKPVVYVQKGSNKAAKKSKVDSKSHLTVLFTILATGKFLPPYVLYAYDRIPTDIKNNFPEGLAHGKAPNGWMTKDSFLHYLKTVIVSYLDGNNVQRPFILFVDGHSSHLSLEVIEFCREHEIVLITLYPNATWIMQPLDVGVFAHFKNMWDAFLLKKDNDFVFVMNNRTFAPALKEFMDTNTAKLEPLVKDSFKDCGIYPWNVEAIHFENMMECCRIRKNEPHKEYDELENVVRFGFSDNVDGTENFLLIFNLILNIFSLKHFFLYRK